MKGKVAAAFILATASIAGVVVALVSKSRQKLAKIARMAGKTC